jgi:LPXTG-motif cell wall-anchored protein
MCVVFPQLTKNGSSEGGNEGNTPGGGETVPPEGDGSQPQGNKPEGEGSVETDPPAKADKKTENDNFFGLIAGITAAVAAVLGIGFFVLKRKKKA